MTKLLLSFSMLILSICILSNKAYAQEDSGGFAVGSIIPVESIDEGAGVFQSSTLPSGVMSIKRNNGNGTSAYGIAEARLHFTNAADININIRLVKVTDMNGNEVQDAVTIFPPTVEKGYLSYSLGCNVNPAKKLVFFFSAPTGNFAIAETN